MKKYLFAAILVLVGCEEDETENIKRRLCALEANDLTPVEVGNRYYVEIGNSNEERLLVQVDGHYALIDPKSGYSVQMGAVLTRDEVLDYMVETSYKSKNCM